MMLWSVAYLHICSLSQKKTQDVKFVAGIATLKVKRRSQLLLLKGSFFLRALTRIYSHSESLSSVLPGIRKSQILQAILSCSPPCNARYWMNLRMTHCNKTNRVDCVHLSYQVSVFLGVIKEVGWRGRGKQTVFLGFQCYRRHNAM